MNTVLLSIILVPIIEIYLFIKIGGEIGALNTILLIFVTAVTGIIYARYEGLNTLRSGFSQIIKNEFKIFWDHYIIWMISMWYQSSIYIQKDSKFFLGK